MDDNQDPVRPARRQRLRRAAVIAAALALLGLSQALWWWETWPVRQLLEVPGHQGQPVQAGVRG